MILRPLLLAVVLLPLAGCRTPPVKVDPVESTAAAPVAVRLLVLDFETMEAREASAFFVRPGVVATCAHVLAGGEPIGVTLPGGRAMTPLFRAIHREIAGRVVTPTPAIRALSNGNVRVGSACRYTQAT